MHKGIGQPINMHRLYAYLGAALGRRKQGSHRSGRKSQLGPRCFLRESISLVQNANDSQD